MRRRSTMPADQPTRRCVSSQPTRAARNTASATTSRSAAPRCGTGSRTSSCGRKSAHELGESFTAPRPLAVRHRAITSIALRLLAGGRTLQGAGSGWRGTLRRALPVLAVVAALFGNALQPPPASVAGPESPTQTDAPGFDGTGGADRNAVQPKAPRQSAAAAKKHFPAQFHHSAGNPTWAEGGGIALPEWHRSPHNDRPAATHIASLRTFIAQPRAPPFSRTV